MVLLELNVVAHIIVVKSAMHDTILEYLNSLSITSTFFIPIVESSAIICLFLLVISTES